MVRNKSLLMFVALLAFAVTEAATWATGYTVYIRNDARKTCWTRSGFDHDVYKSEQACRASIEKRKAENKKYRTDYESFAIVYSACRPKPGCYSKSTVPCSSKSWIIYKSPRAK